MREITAHHVIDTPNTVRVFAEDDPGPGGAHHAYKMYLQDVGCREFGSSYPIKFQKGPLQGDGAAANGVTNEALIAVAIDRLECFQSGPFACPENAKALGFLQKALKELHRRTKDRQKRGVEGKLVR